MPSQVPISPADAYPQPEARVLDRRNFLKLSGLLGLTGCGLVAPEEPVDPSRDDHSIFDADGTPERLVPAPGEAQYSPKAAYDYARRSAVNEAAGIASYIGSTGVKANRVLDFEVPAADGTPVSGRNIFYGSPDAQYRLKSGEASNEWESWVLLAEGSNYEFEDGTKYTGPILIVHEGYGSSDRTASYFMFAVGPNNPALAALKEDNPTSAQVIAALQGESDLALLEMSHFERTLEKNDQGKADQILRISVGANDKGKPAFGTDVAPVYIDGNPYVASASGFAELDEAIKKEFTEVPVYRGENDFDETPAN